MKTLQPIFATVLLALALGVPVLGGDMGGATSPVPPPPPLGEVSTDNGTPNGTSTPGALPPTAPGEMPPLTDAALYLLFWALSVY